MSTATQISLSEYLETAFRPDREYIDGEVLQRNMGKWEHAGIQWLLAGWFGRHEREWNVIGSAEQRIRVKPNRVRVPDLVVLRPAPQPEVLTEPSLLIVEIFSPDDNYSGLQERSQDYFAMGVETVWMIDPATHSGRMCRGAEWLASDRLEIPGTPIFVLLADSFRPD